MLTKEEFRDRIDEISRSCSERNWDSYDADPISQDACVVAKKIVDKLPINFLAKCNIGPDPDGYIAFEWDCDNGLLCLEAKELVRWELNRQTEERARGIFPFAGELPDYLVSIIRLITKSEKV